MSGSRCVNIRTCPVEEFKECKTYFECPFRLGCIENKCRCIGNERFSFRVQRCIPCPRGWIAFENICYFISDERLSWVNARRYCESRSARLLSITTKTIIDFSRLFFEKNKLNGSFHVGALITQRPNRWFWLNGYRIPVNGPWWTDCYSPSSAQNFIGFDKDCAQLSKNGLIKVSCNLNRARFICEQNIEDNEEMSNMRTGLSLKIRQAQDLFGTRCNRNDQCGRDLRCIRNFCSCPADFFWSRKSKKCVDCPINFVFFEDSCYFISKTYANFTEAKQNCESQNSHLIMLKTPVLIDILAEILNGFYVYGKVWTGGLSVNEKDYWLDGCKIEEGPWWDLCLSARTEKNVMCIYSEGLSLKKSDCSIRNKYICKQ
ncbi:unnamed protein product, partial [Brachionus calyciflorus]